MSSPVTVAQPSWRLGPARCGGGFGPSSPPPPGLLTAQGAGSASGFAFEPVGDGTQGLAEDQGDQVRVTAGPSDPVHDGGDAVSNEGQDAAGQISGERDLLGELGTLGCVRVGAVRSGMPSTSM